MKLIIQIPCYNEEKSLPLTLRHLPRELDHINTVEWLIVDDGSTDDTVRVAHENGVDHVVELHHNQGLSLTRMRTINMMHEISLH
jgi:glycosyltransferase involved in cell wall biosynthesis